MDEIPLFYDKLPIIACFYAIRIHEGISPDLRVSLQNAGVTIKRYSADNEEIEYSIIMEFATGPKGVAFPCHLLYGESCVAHSHGKPTRCELFPLNPFVAHDLIGSALELISDRCLGLSCSGEGPIIWDKKNKDTHLDFFMRLQQQKGLAKMILDISTGADNSSIIEELVGLAESGGGFIYTPIPPLDSITSAFGVSADEYSAKQIPRLERLYRDIQGKIGDHIVLSQIDMLKTRVAAI